MELGRKAITWTAIHKYDNGTTLYLCDSECRRFEVTWWARVSEIVAMLNKNT
jgi:hypothetical protein